MPFGLSPAPCLFTKILKPAVGVLRQSGMRLVIYLDDIIILNESRDGALQDLDTTNLLFSSLDFVINWEKSVREPSRSMEFLGMIIDSVTLSLASPNDKVSSILSICSQALVKKWISLSELASLLGNFSWAIPTVSFAQAHYRNLQSFYISHSRFVVILRELSSLRNMLWRISDGGWKIRIRLKKFLNNQWHLQL